MPSRSLHPSISPANSASPIKEQDFINIIKNRAVKNTDSINFRFTITNKVYNRITKEYDISTEIRTEQPQYKLFLDKEHNQFVYFSLFHTEEWIYIYIPDIPEDDKKDEPYKYTVYKEEETYTENKKIKKRTNRFYKGNHLSLNYNEDECGVFYFHYTEYDDNYKKSKEDCNFKLDSVFIDELNNNNLNLKCLLCDKNDDKTYVRGVLINPGHVNEKIQKHVFNILYKIINIIKSKKQRSKNSAKIKRVLAERATRDEAIKNLELSRRNKELAKEKKTKSALGDLDPNLLAYLLDEPSSNKPKNQKKNSNTGNAKKK